LAGTAKPETSVSNPGETFYGWRLVAALGVVLFFSGGGGLYVFPVFIQSFQNEFGWSLTEISAGVAIFAIVMGLSGPLVGVLFARIGARATMLGAAVLLAAASFGYANLHSLNMLYAFMMVSGLGVAGTTILPTQALVTHWFDLYRGRALGLAMLGIGFGGFLLPPFNEFLIRAIGWRLTWGVSAGVIIVVVIPVIWRFVRQHPADLGLQQDGMARTHEADPTRQATGLPLRQALRTVSFWLVMGVFLLQLIALSALNFHFIPFAIQQGGFTPSEAASFLGLTVGFSIAGRLLFGWWVDHANPRWLMALSGVLLALGPLVLEFLVIRLGTREAWLLLFYAIPFGIGIGGNAITLPVLVGRCFGELYFSQIMGSIMSGFALGILIGIPGAGRIFDQTGSYELVLLICIVSLLLSATLAASVRPDRYLEEFVRDTIS